MAPQIHIPKIQSANVRREGNRVKVLSNGRLVLDLPYDAALVLAKAVRIQAKRAEEWDKAESIVHDQAILTRLGANIGLSSHPVIQKEAGKEAAWNSDLRRYIRGRRAKGVESQEQVGEPTVTGGKKDG